MKQYTHSELVDIAARWLKGRCGVVIPELSTIAGEIPDVFGFRSDSTWLIECKCSRSDFLADKNKTFRKSPFLGMGDFRFYCAPKGLIKIEELPELWGLIEVDNGNAKLTHNPHGKGNIYYSHKRHEKSKLNEYLFMYSILRRMEIKQLTKEVCRFDDFTQKD